MKDTVVLYPGQGMGHIIPFVELAKLFIRHDLSVVVVLIDTHFNEMISALDSFVSHVSAEHPLITFHRLPKPHLPSPPPSNPILLSMEFLRLTNPILSDFLTTLSSTTSNIRALVLDMFCTSALDVARDLGLPAYFFFASAASGLAIFLFTPTLHSQVKANFKEMGGTPLNIPGLPPIPASDFPDSLSNPKDEFTHIFSSKFQRLAEGDGIMVNTFREMEHRALQALADGLCLPGGRIPPIYAIGPLIAAGSGDGGEKHECLKWLDAQPKGSVVFLCFGSMGALSEEQLVEIAAGLEGSGQRFLWVVRSPPSKDPAKRFAPKPEPDLSVLMPEGFLERTEGRGLVVKSWAPQVEVLRHEAVAGFVSHCGWNSTLEAVSAGVPIIAWPLYAEQRMNKVVLVEEMKIAAEMKGYDKEMVSAEEVETKVRWLMESEGGRELKERAAAMKERAEAARREGGSSEEAWMEMMSMLMTRRAQ